MINARCNAWLERVIRHAYLITVATDAHEEVIWFDISVDEVLGVYIFNSADHLRIKIGQRSNISPNFQS